MYTVKELIEVLTELPQDFEVIIESWSYSSPIDAIGIDHNNRTIDLFADV